MAAEAHIDDTRDLYERILTPRLLYHFLPVATHTVEFRWCQVDQRPGGTLGTEPSAPEADPPPSQTDTPPETPPEEEEQTPPIAPPAASQPAASPPATPPTATPPPEARQEAGASRQDNQQLQHEQDEQRPQRASRESSVTVWGTGCSYVAFRTKFGRRRLEMGNTPLLRMAWEPCCRRGSVFFAGILRDLVVSFASAFLFHLVPAIAFNTEHIVLSSSATRSLAGQVVCIGVPFWFAVLQLMRPWGLLITDAEPNGGGSSRGDDEASAAGHHKREVFVPFASRQHAAAAARYWDAMCGSSSATEMSDVVRVDVPVFWDRRAKNVRMGYDKWCCSIALLGWAFFVFSLVSFGFALKLIVDCQRAGCCWVEDGRTLESCISTTNA